MTVDELLAELKGLPDVVLHPGAPEDAIEALERRYGIRLPAVHRELLLRTDGIEANGGYLRLYSVEHMGAWNEPELWKFAWHPCVNDVFCVGGTAWDMQFGLRLSEIAADRMDAPMYMVTARDQWVQPSRQTFATYLEVGFLGNARHKYSEWDRRVRKKVGDLAPGDLLALAPNWMLGGTQALRNVVKLPAVTVMIVEGDMRAEYLRVTRNLTRDVDITAVVPYVDEEGRRRIRLRTDRRAYGPSQA